MLGDFNLDLMKEQHYNLYNDLVLLGLDQLIHEVTRPESKSCLTHVYVNNPTNVLSSSVVSMGLSDHCPVTVVRKHNGSFAKNNLHKTIRYRDFKHFDEHQFVEQLTHVPWSLISMADDVEVKVDLFEQLYLSVLNEHAPIVEKRVKTIRQPPWFTADLGILILDRDRLFNSYKHSHDRNALTAYKRAKNHVNHAIRKAKREFYIKTLEQQRQNPRVIWNHIKSSLA